MNDWTDQAARLADELIAAGKLRSPEWISAIRVIPRHELVPLYYEQDHQLGRPGWDRFGLTVTPGRQWVWLDSPHSNHTWPLPL